MPVEFVGWVAPRVSSEIIAPKGPTFSPSVIAQTARIHEQADFDRVLIGYFSNGPDGFMLGAHAASVTQRLQFLLAHRPGFVAPTLAARKLATLDQLSSGRLAVHIISGGSDIDQARDGDYTAHDARYRRSAEYTEVLKKIWTSRAAVDHEGEFYRFEGAHTEVYCQQRPRIPIYGGGGSAAAIEHLSPGIDVFMLWGEPLAETQAFMSNVRAAAGANPIQFSLSTRPILADSEAKAWDRANSILAEIKARTPGGPPARQNIGSKRLLDVAARQDVHDSCLFTALAAATGASGNSTALVGTPDTVADALVKYYDLGIRTLLIRGYDPLVDAEQYGRELIPRVRQLVAQRDADQSQYRRSS